MIYWNRTYKGKNLNSSKKVIKSSNEHPGYTKITDEGELKKQLDAGVTVYAKNTGPFGGDEGATVVAFGDVSDADVSGYINYDGDITEFVEEFNGIKAIVLDESVGQSDENFYMLDGGHEISDFDLYVSDDEYIVSSKKSIKSVKVPKSVNLDEDSKKLLDKLEKRNRGEELVIKVDDDNVPYILIKNDGRISENYLNRLAEDYLYDGYGVSGEYVKIFLNPSIMYTFDKVKSSRKPVVDVNFYKNVVRSVLSNRRSEESAVRSIALRNKCNIGYAKNIFNNYMDKYRDELIKSDAEIADIHKDFNVDGDLNSWAEDYMPGSGKANTKGGELVRAAQRILTEYYDGGNMIGRGLGNETVNPAARYIVKNTSYEGNGEIEDMLNHIVRMDDGEYDSWLKRFENDFADWLRGNEELFAEPNDDDMADYAEDDDREIVLNKFYVEDSSGNQYFFRNDDDKFVCTGVEFAQDPVYYEDDTFADGDELSSDIDKTEDYGLVEKDGFSYDWEAVGNTDDDGNYSEWRVVRVSIADQLFEVDDVLDIEDMENYSVFDVNGNKIEEKDFMAL